MEIYPKVKLIYWQILATLTLATVLVWIAVFSLRPDPYLRITAFDIGQGDAIFIQTPARTQVLIDGGPNSTVLSKIGKTLPFYDRSLDLIVLTHAHADHVVGLVDVLKRYKVSALLMTDAVYQSAAYAEFLKIVETQKIKKYIAHDGQKVYFDDQAVMTILYPTKSLKDVKFTDLNEASLVGRLSYGTTDFLFMGDALKDVEEILLSLHVKLASEFLKVGHHGSRGSSHPAFIAAVHPLYAVISAGKNNRYGHPHAETLQTLDAAGVKIFRTDQDGDVRMVSDGTKITEQ